MEEIFNDQAILRVFAREGTGPEYPSVKDTRVATLGCAEGLEYPRCQTVPIEELCDSRPILRVIFPKLSLPNTRFTDGLLWLVREYSIPTTFLQGGIRSVAHSLGSTDTKDGYRCCWVNCLSKSITVTEIAGSEPVVTDHRLGGLEKHHGDMTWFRSGFFLRWPSNPLSPPHVTLIFFGALSVMARFQRLTYSAVKDVAVRDPVSLLVVILHSLADPMDQNVWDLSRVFGTNEFKALEMDSDWFINM
ncbi:hypothetical protein BJY04DRAFT_219033 [Aspergillus karnatakaensis]|uniref:uncharacterized protein n=1 Tax=Aspergillus karnatakaensis TaxID=1810916 RepID=UPI003CCCF2D1